MFYVFFKSYIVNAGIVSRLSLRTSGIVAVAFQRTVFFFVYSHKFLLYCYDVFKLAAGE